MAKELDKIYRPKDFEERIYKMWKENGDFSPRSDGEKYFSVVMPPPNVTGILHMGHALNNSLQDIIIRYHRMKGERVLWVPGTDHAGIATQNVVERMLKAEGKSRADLGREKFLERTWQVKEKHHSIIKEQLEKMGCSCDWERERFTMDEGLSRAVREAFVSLYEKGLVYRDNYLVNYCPKCGTALSDDEVEFENVEGRLYSVTYPYADGSGSITVATTRPETMFGDTAVAVNPDDERYKDIVGKELLLPLTERKIPIITDSFVDKEFGTGLVKITPAHDMNDFECGRRHGLEEINILNPDGTLNENVPEKFRGLKAEEARALVVNDLREKGYLVDEKRHDHDVGHCYRCHTIVEPYLSLQWFVNMKSLAEKALSAKEKKDIVFYPARWENTYTRWLENIKPWCISRQLWWGHRIPVWYCDDCSSLSVSTTELKQCAHCHSANIRQDSDVLDTWFSSWLWPFSTLGWPDETEDLKTFFPTSALVSGYDIIFFWISRMIMASEEFLDASPFHSIVITGLVRDIKGRKMSKSLGNGIDPLEIIDEYGADAMKFTLSYLAAQGQDVLIDKKTFSFGSRFANKIWNAVRFLLLNAADYESINVEKESFSVMDKWIYSRFNRSCLAIERAMEEYRFNDASQAVYSFFWNDFCDWYIEGAKDKLEREEKEKTIAILLDLTEKSMRLLHPFLSFLTEEIYQTLPFTKGRVINALYPVLNEEEIDDEAEALVSLLQSIVRAIRAARANFSITPEKKIGVRIVVESDDNALSFLQKEKVFISSLIGSNKLEIEKDVSGGKEKTLPVSGLGFRAFLSIQDALDVEEEIERLEKDKKKNEDLLKESEKKLGNENFVKNAKKEALDKEKAKKEEFREKIRKDEENIKILRTF